MQTELYRHYDADSRLLYVGISFSTGARAKQHMMTNGWATKTARIEIERFPFRWLAEEAEKTAIMTERPLFNVVHNRIPREASGTARNVPISPPSSGPSAKAGEAVLSTRVSKGRAGAKRLGSRGPAPGSGGRPKKGTEGKTLRATRPWEAEGISQRTWYRRQKESSNVTRGRE